MSVPWAQLGKKEERFSYTMQSTGEVVHIAVERLNRYLAARSWPVKPLLLYEELVMAIATRNGIELEHLGRITPQKIVQPITVIDMEDGSHIVCDGSHRLLAWALAGKDRCPAWIVPKPIWRRFTISNTPYSDAEWSAGLKRAQIISTKGIDS